MEKKCSSKYLALFTLILTIVLPLQLFAADEYRIDPVHSSVLFKIKHLGISNIYGKFADFRGALKIDQENPTKNSIEAYLRDVGKLLEYIHIKDAKFIAETDGIFPEAKFTWPGDGDGDVKRIVGDLLSGGYDGGISIEPHLGAVFHDESKQSSEGAQYDTYVEYGKRMEKLIAEVTG